MFVSPSMFRREERMTVARKDTQRNLRDLRRDRSELERHEKQLMAQLRMFVKKGDFPKANLLAKQIALYRNLADKNFERGVAIETEIQVLLSNHKINRAHAESIKGIRHSNMEQTLESARDKELKYQRRMEECEAIEAIMNEGFEDVYDLVEIRKERPGRFVSQVEDVFREALSSPGSTVHREHYASSEADEGQAFNGRVCLGVRNYKSLTESGGESANVYIPTLDISVDMLKQLIIRDKRALRLLGLDADRSCDFVVGGLVRFENDEYGAGGSSGGDDRSRDGGGQSGSMGGFNGFGGGGESGGGSPRSSTSPQPHVSFGGQLGAGSSGGGPFNGGRSFSYRFVPFDITESLKNQGIRNGGHVWIMAQSQQ
ncbi:hypothetical protein BC831DRAFT_447264 [Entophlyctis helioformis]|nr:hypothetical protein BC831DRAFT_447264 [Entophlyctis helioformis]